MISVAAEPIFHIGGIAISNSIFTGWIVVVLFLIVGLIVRKGATLAPRGFLNLVDALVEFLLAEVEKVTGDRKRARLFFPIVAALFFFIWVSNWMGLLPGMGSIGLREGTDLIPLFRPATSDLNFTLAIAVFSVVLTHVLGVATLGPVNHVSKFVNIRGILKSMKHGPMAVAVAVVEFFVGLLEIISEVAKTLSLALRLFGNIFAGEVLLTVIYGLAGFLIPLPFLFLELLVGVIQATVFAMLVLVFLTTMTEMHGELEEAESEELAELSH